MVDAISIRQLRSFAAVAHYKGFSVAANALNQSQPSITQHVKQLEAHLGIMLFDRRPRSVDLTHQGSLFLETVKRLLRDFDIMVEDARTLAEHRRGTARIACPASMTQQLLIPAVRDLRTDHPGITIAVTEIDEPVVHELVRNGHVEFALTGTWIPAADLYYEEVFQDRACVVFERGHWLESQDPISMEHLTDCPFVRAPSGTTAETFTQRTVAESGIAINTACEVSQLMSTAAMVEQGIGISILPALSFATVSRFNVKGKLLHEPELWRSCGFVVSRRRALSAPAELLRSYLLKHLQDLCVTIPGAMKLSWQG